jgi:hypothetical protein
VIIVIFVSHVSRRGKAPKLLECARSLSYSLLSLFVDVVVIMVDAMVMSRWRGGGDIFAFLCATSLAQSLTRDPLVGL